MQVTKIKLNPWGFVGVFLLGLFGVTLFFLFANSGSGGFGFGGIIVIPLSLLVIVCGLALYILFSSGATEPDDVVVSGQAVNSFSAVKILRVAAWIFLFVIAGLLVYWAFLLRSWV
jgi:hypothetical protein